MPNQLSMHRQLIGEFEPLPALSGSGMMRAMYQASILLENNHALSD
jgi:hypothetical protein